MRTELHRAGLAPEPREPRREVHMTRLPAEATP